eukprot:SAG31_NODE_4146_length_3533_cov_2.126674_2_plen_425_part_00
MVERKQRKTYACELHRERGSGLNAPSMIKMMEWENKWRNTGRGVHHPTPMESASFRPLHSRCSVSTPGPGTKGIAIGDTQQASWGLRPKSVTWEDQEAADTLSLPESLGRNFSRQNVKPALSTTQQLFQERTVRSVSPPPRPAHSTQRQLSHTSYIFGNVEVVTPVGRRDTLTPLHHTGWIQPLANLTLTAERPSSVSNASTGPNTANWSASSAALAARAPSCPPVLSSCGQFPSEDERSAPGWRSSQKLSEVFTECSGSAGDNLLSAAKSAGAETFPVGARALVNPGPQRTTIYGSPVPNLPAEASGMMSTNAMTSDDIRKWNRPHRFNSSGLPYWPCVSYRCNCVYLNARPSLEVLNFNYVVAGRIHQLPEGLATTQQRTPLFILSWPSNHSRNRHRNRHRILRPGPMGFTALERRTGGCSC